MLTTVLFYIFATVSVIAALGVVSSKSPVHCVLMLILAFFNVAGLFVLLGAEFLAMLLVIVYVGAVAVLFLFVVMMLNVDCSRLRDSFVKHLPIGILIAIILFAEIFTMVNVSVDTVSIVDKSVIAAQDGALTNTEMLGMVIYTDYALLFQLSGLILLVAMIGAIVLTHRKREGVRKQVIKDQVMRNPKTAVTLVSVETGKGVE